MARLDVIAFDADDTLWHNEDLYLSGKERCREILEPYGLSDVLDSRLDEIEIGNLRYYGYGVSGFVFSLIETAIDLTEGAVTGKELKPLLDLSREMLTAEVRLFDHAENALALLANSYPLMMITKGELFHQQNKIARSGVEHYFQSVEVVSDKTPQAYAALLDRHGLQPGRFMMVGNSLRSDILPVLEIGGWAVYIPHELTWAHEEVDLQEMGKKRFYQLEHLGELVDLLESLDGDN